MVLPAGTALQDGHYIIDALLETAPNGHLYWGTHVPTGMPIYLQALSVTANPDPHTLAKQLQSLAFDPQPPLPYPFQAFQAEERLFIATGTNLGLPWSFLYQFYAPVSTRQALSLTRRVAEGALALIAQGLREIDLSPNRIWICPMRDRVFLTGLTPVPSKPVPSKPVPSKDVAAATDPSETGRDRLFPQPVQALAALLYSLLTGELPPPNPSDIGRSLQPSQFTVSPVIVEAIRQGLSQPAPADWTLAIREWLHLLPDTPRVAAPMMRFQPNLSKAGIKHSPEPPAPSRRPIYSALTLTALVAGVAGIGAGAVWRLMPDSLPGKVRFSPEQNFPALSNWSGDNPAPSLDASFQQRQRSQQDWSVEEWEPIPIEEEASVSPMAPNAETAAPSSGATDIPDPDPEGAGAAPAADSAPETADNAGDPATPPSAPEPMPAAPDPPPAAPAPESEATDTSPPEPVDMAPAPAPGSDAAKTSET